jgi:hypothetical protein
MSNVAIIEPRADAQPRMMTGGKIAAIIPQSMEDAYRLAKAVCMAGMNPKGMDTPEKCMIAIMRGLEVGLTPFQALDKIAIVNGRPTIFGDGAMALVRGSGLCEGIRETIEGEGEKAVAKCVAKRKGEAEPIVGVFSVDDAKKAGLWGKAGPWQQFPKRMLQMRARAFALRDGFADVLGGLYLKEEIEDNEPRREPPTPAPTERTVQPAQAPQAAASPRLPPAPPPAPPKAIPAPPQVVPAPFDFDTFADSFRAELKSLGHTLDESNAIYTRMVERHASLTDDQRSECDAILREHAAAFWDDPQ